MTGVQTCALPICFPVTITSLMAISKDEATLLETYVTKFKDILPDKKVAQLFVVEEDYKRFLLQQIRNTSNHR